MYKLPERGGGGRGNSGNARKKTFFCSGGVPLVLRLVLVEKSSDHYQSVSEYSEQPVTSIG